MIRIQRPPGCVGFVPNGEAATQALYQARADDPLLGQSKAHPLAFRKSVYGAKPIKARLRAAQFDKCCFCENYFAGNYPGDVEHFRPKARVQQARGEPLVYPGYFWLAYRWSNLTFACYMCNASAKGEQFPVADPVHRAIDLPGRNLEGAQLVDPSRDDPREHIGFNLTTPVAKTERGATTIRVLKLDRADLERPRLSQIKHLNAMLRLAALRGRAHAEDREDALAQLHAALEPTAIFTSMNRDYLADKGWAPAIARNA
ncbi:hypothetical protein [Novosphingobium sp. B1]|uniref:hypothetical protein n=1 Tax=Novosphingobium sp. B1 TaxID=1938756 RepID=UPI0009D7F573|nr:hypothetical protein [Novosphingobium sp. B1]SMD06156.1 TIGR02646 family protein [Novosphingobium sp. B1]